MSCTKFGKSILYHQMKGPASIHKVCRVCLFFTRPMDSQFLEQQHAGWLLLLHMEQRWKPWAVEWCSIHDLQMLKTTQIILLDLEMSLSSFHSQLIDSSAQLDFMA